MHTSADAYKQSHMYEEEVRWSVLLLLTFYVNQKEMTKMKLRNRNNIVFIRFHNFFRSGRLYSNSTSDIVGRKSHKKRRNLTSKSRGPIRWGVEISFFFFVGWPSNIYPINATTMQPQSHKRGRIIIIKKDCPATQPLWGLIAPTLRRKCASNKTRSKGIKSIDFLFSCVFLSVAMLCFHLFCILSSSGKVLL